MLPNRSFVDWGAFVIGGEKGLSPALCTLASRDLCSDEVQLARGLSLDGCILLGSSHEIGQYLIHRSVGEILGDVVAGMGEIEREVVTHAVKLREEDALVIGSDTQFSDELGCHQATVLVMSTDEDLEMCDPLQYEAHAFVVVTISSNLINAYGIGVAALVSQHSLFFHIGTADKLNARDESIFERSFMYALQEQHPIVSVHLQCGKDNSSLFIIESHCFDGEFIHYVLVGYVLGIDQKMDAVFVCHAAERHKPMAESAESLFFLKREGLLATVLFEDLGGAYTAGLEYTVADVGIGAGKLQRTDGLLIGGFDVGLGTTSFCRIVQYGHHSAPTEIVDSVAGIL